jgi:DNA polymerase
LPNVRWTILTPDTSAVWDTRELRFGPGGQRSDAPAEDAAEDLWRSYYASIFNPARLNVQAMQSHMPKKYWRNLPESAAIPGLIRSAKPRTQAMIDAPATVPAKHHRSAAELARRGVWRSDAEHDPQVESATLAELAERARHCRGCDLWRNATQTVFGEGPADARVVLVGEQPGDQEDLRGSPFVGPAGKLLDRALREAGVERAAVYVTNAVKHFKFEPRGKRRLHKTPSQQQIAACRSWLERELEMVRPSLVVALGATAARALLGRDVPIQANRGRMLEGARVAGAALLITVHPSYLLRLPESEREVAYRAFVADLALIGRHISDEEHDGDDPRGGG